MKRCPITYEMIDNSLMYSKKGLRLLAPSMKTLLPLAFSAGELRQEAAARVGKMSIQGVQPKVSAILNAKENRMELVDEQGRYILKPPSEYYLELPENEAITMTLAASVGIEVPLHGLIYAKDNSLTYFVKRFDRERQHAKLSVEDFAQLMERRRDTKYQSSMEQVAQVVQKYCSFPKIEVLKLFKLTLFNYLVGNEDMHLKNFSLITRDNKILLSPAYDLLNTTIAQKNVKEELALPLNEKKNHLMKKDLMLYFPDYLGLNAGVVSSVTNIFSTILPQWQVWITTSFLSKTMQQKYLDLLNMRSSHLGFI
jgi:serine/threonine-protein kinase HipA